ncbi:MAG: hypothetical protein L0H96_02355 [Humibacillus sp.]|nr:hypothetical protein [Humibacillus sp.]MDN5775734.1 hypothetical protein [Humibacillus sp.]
MSHPASENENTLGRTAARTEPSGLSEDSSDVSDDTFVSSAGDGRATASEAGSSKTDAAKEQGQQVKDEAVDGGKRVAGVASEQGQSVLSEAGDQAQDLMGQARSQLTEQAVTQQENLTSWLRSLADELHQMVDRGSDQGSPGRSDSSTEQQNHTAGSTGVATHAASQAQGRVNEAADWLERHEPGDLIDEATRFARRRPGAFLAIAAVGGLLAGRFTRGLKDDTSTSTEPSPGDTAEAPDLATLGGDPTLGDAATGQSVDQPDEQMSGFMGAPVAAVPPAPSAPTGFGSGDPVGQAPR